MKKPSIHISVRNQFKLRLVITAILISCLSSISFSLMQRNIEVHHILNGLYSGLLVSFLIIGFELFLVQTKLRRSTFLQVLVARTSVYIMVIVLLILTHDPNCKDKKQLVFSLGITILFSLGLTINSLLGRGVFLKFLIGKYHHPIEEKRIFMMLDLNDSTSIAEKIGPLKFLSLLNDFFYDISDPIIESRGEIYKYVGDAAIITWDMTHGLADANCLKSFFAINNVIKSKHNYYLNKYGIIPDFKAALHCGLVVTGEIGDEKREIAYLGDVINTTQRIETLCKTLGQRLLVSDNLISQVELPCNYQALNLGEYMLRGREQPVTIYFCEQR